MSNSISDSTDQSDSPATSTRDKHSTRVRRVNPPMSNEERALQAIQQKCWDAKRTRAEATLAAELVAVGQTLSDLEPDELEDRVVAVMCRPPEASAQADLDEQCAREALVKHVTDYPLVLYRSPDHADVDPIAIQNPAPATGHTPLADQVSTTSVLAENTIFVDTPIVASKPEKILGDYVRVHRLNRISGLSGIGKTLVTHELAARVSTGTRILDFSSHHAANVLYLTAPEDGLATHEQRLGVAQADRSRINIVDVLDLQEMEKLHFETADVGMCHDFLRATIRAKHIELIVINPAYSFVTHERMDETLDEWARLAEEERVTIIAVDYEGPHQHGFAALSDRLRKKARANLVVEPVPTGQPNERLLRLPKSNDVSDDVKRTAIKFRIVAVDDTPKIEWLGLVEVDAPSQVSSRRGPRPAKREEVARWLRELVEGHDRIRSCDGLAAAKKAGHSPATVYRAMKEAGVVSEPVTHGPGVWWRRH